MLRVLTHWYSDGTIIINVGGGYVQKINAFSVFEYHMFYVLYPFVASLLIFLSLAHIRPYPIWTTK
jgi:hypothetical protein